MRAERDELRRRDARMRAQLATLKESVKVSEGGSEWGLLVIMMRMPWHVCDEMGSLDSSCLVKGSPAQSTDA
jgi:hypothetical protein